MERRAQALIIILWILLMLTVITVSIAHRVSFSLRLCSYQKGRLKTLYLAKAGLNRAIKEIEKDVNLYDTPDEPWADNEEVFKQIALSDNQAEFAAVGYTIVDENKEERPVYGARDEERKININKASYELLVILLEKCGIEGSADKANNMLIWRGDKPDDDKIYDALGYPCKGSPFSNIEEIKLVKDISEDDFVKLKEYVTIYSDDDKLNANTSPKEVLAVFAESLAENEEQKSYAGLIVDDIVAQREEKEYFKSISEIDIRDVEASSSADDALYTNLKNKLIVRSNNFLIEATGNAGKIKNKITVVYKRNGTLLYWHEG
ncbi:MAG: type II secretion system protein GspK [Candidatus Omnitrophota bacterium]|nr:type II secretion system protein GspK [Candidatus Omnitrophota bacterium]